MIVDNFLANQSDIDKLSSLSVEDIEELEAIGAYSEDYDYEGPVFTMRELEAMGVGYDEVEV